MSAVELFTYNGSRDVRVVIGQDGEPRFVASDVCVLLEVGRTHDAVRGLDDDEKGAETIRTLGGDQTVTVVTEPGLYSLILRSRKPEAKAIKRWITHEVLPQIRRTGSYESAPALTEDEIVHQALAITVRRVDELTARVAALEPSAQAWDRLHELGTEVEVADAAKILSRDPNITIGRNRLFEYMHDLDWVFRGRHNCWKAYQDQVDLGRLNHRPGGEYFHKPSGEFRTGDPTIVVTAKGLADLRKLLGGAPQLTLVPTQ